MAMVMAASLASLRLPVTDSKKSGIVVGIWVVCVSVPTMDGARGTVAGARSVKVEGEYPLSADASAVGESRLDAGVEGSLRWSMDNVVLARVHSGLPEDGYQVVEAS